MTKSIWLHLTKLIHSNCHQPYISSETYREITEDSHLNDTENLNNFIETWGEYVDDVYTERGYHVTQEYVDLPPKEWVEKKIIKSEAKIINHTKKLFRYKKLLKEYK